MKWAYKKKKKQLWSVWYRYVSLKYSGNSSNPLVRYIIQIDYNKLMLNSFSWIFIFQYSQAQLQRSPHNGKKILCHSNDVGSFRRQWFFEWWSDREYYNLSRQLCYWGDHCWWLLWLANWSNLDAMPPFLAPIQLGQIPWNI